MTQTVCIHMIPCGGPADLAGAVPPTESWQRQPGEFAAPLPMADFDIITRTPGLQ